MASRPRFHYRCEKGHHVVANEDNLDVCPAKLSEGPSEPIYRCGAELDLPMVDWAEAKAWFRSRDVLSMVLPEGPRIEYEDGDE
jgi:hypothetical protein